MWMSIIVKAVTSDMAKTLIALLINKLLEHKEDGVTKDVAETILDGVAKSRSNNAPQSAIDAVKALL